MAQRYGVVVNIRFAGIPAHFMFNSACLKHEGLFGLNEITLHRFAGFTRHARKAES